MTATAIEESLTQVCDAHRFTMGLATVCTCGWKTNEPTFSEDMAAARDHVRALIVALWPKILQYETLSLAVDELVDMVVGRHPMM